MEKAVCSDVSFTNEPFFSNDSLTERTDSFTPTESVTPEESVTPSANQLSSQHSESLAVGSAGRYLNQFFGERLISRTFSEAEALAYLSPAIRALIVTLTL